MDDQEVYILPTQTGKHLRFDGPLVLRVRRDSNGTHLDHDSYASDYQIPTE